MPSLFQQIPQVSALLLRPDIAALTKSFPRWAVQQAVRDELEARRALLREQNELAQTPWTPSIEALMKRTAALCQSPLRRVVNGTGVVLHTGLGRAKLAKSLFPELGDQLSGYTNLAYDLDTGKRGHRHEHLSALLGPLTHAEAHLVVNNNAAAVLLTLSALCAGRQVVVSRGELVEIGGSFRVPDVMRASNAVLREVGCTNKTHRSDYVCATDAQTAAYLKVHRSNFAQVGFTQEVPLADLAALAHAAGVLCLYDLGSGALVTPTPEPEPTVAQAIAQGADLVMFSGDKLLGGPQAGLLCGKRTLIDRLASHPLYRALRPDKLTLYALLHTLRLYRDGRTDEIPTQHMLQQTPQVLHTRATALLQTLAHHNVPAELVQVESAVGGGAMPFTKLPSWAVSPRCPAEDIHKLQARLRGCELPVIARLAEGKILLDVRTIADDEFEAIAQALAQALP